MSVAFHKAVNCQNGNRAIQRSTDTKHGRLFQFHSALMFALCIHGSVDDDSEYERKRRRKSSTLDAKPTQLACARRH